jgi:uncharacterized membrane protein
MPYCSKCGSFVSENAAFCPKCGAPVSSESGPSQPAGPAGASSTGMTSNVAGALSYLAGFVTGIIFLVIEPFNKDPFVRFHAFQSIFFNIAIVVIVIVWSILTAIMGSILGLLGTLFSLLGLLIWLGFVACWLFLMYKAYKNERYMLPVIGELASKQAG